MTHKWLKVFLGCCVLGLPFIAEAQGISVDFGKGGSLANNIFHTMAFLTIVSLAPSILVMVTSFTRMVVVFSFLRTAIGLQQSPPNPVLVSLALFLTFYVMGPVFEKSYEEGIKPYIEEKIDDEEAWHKTAMPFKNFMLDHVREKDLQLFINLGKDQKKEQKDLGMQVVVPAFMISELRRAFEMGFLVFIPFLVIDMVVASILMAMGMMMLPPATISLPFKVIFFVLIDGWHLISGTLVRSFETLPPG